MKLKLHEKIIFLFLVFLLSFSLYSLTDYIILSFDEYRIIEGLPEGITNPDDVDINKLDYGNQIKSLNKYGLSTKGSWSALENNIKGLKKIVEGITIDHKKSLKGGYNVLGVKYPINTGYTCNDPNDESHELYTYIDNTSKSGIGLLGVVGDAIGKYGQSMSDFSDITSSGSSEQSKCREATLFVKTNSGISTKQTVHIDERELEKIQGSNIQNIKDYPNTENDQEESFINMNDLLINDDLFYKDYFIFTYFLMLNLLFLYYIFIIVINN